MILWLTAVAGLSAIGWLRDGNRETALRALALRRGLTFLGRELPRSFTLSGTALEGATSIRNAMERDCGLRVLAFDCHLRTFKGSWRCTAIAVQGPPHVFGAPKFNSELTVDRSNDWSILYEPKTLSLIPQGLMSVSEIEAHFDSLSC
jgi:hypothetical protein